MSAALSKKHGSVRHSSMVAERRRGDADVRRGTAVLEVSRRETAGPGHADGASMKSCNFEAWVQHLAHPLQ
jgi:hypothetical protein